MSQVRNVPQDLQKASKEQLEVALKDVWALTRGNLQYGNMTISIMNEIHRRGLEQANLRTETAERRAASAHRWVVALAIVSIAFSAFDYLGDQRWEVKQVAELQAIRTALESQAQPSRQAR